MAGASLEAGAYPAYFRALETGRAVAASDAHRDPRTIELAADYLAPLGIGAMLEAPIRHDGRLAGVVCHEHVGPPRQWLIDEKIYAASIADLAAMALDAGERARLADRLARSEERYRTFVSLSTEGILRVEISPPVSLEAPVEDQVAHIRRHGVVAEANASLAKLLGAASPKPLIGRTLESLVRSDAAEKVLTEWIRAGYRFSEYEIDLVGVDGATLWLLGSMIGVTTDGKLVGAVEHLAEHHTPQGGGAGARVPGPPRSADRPAEPQVARRTAGRGARDLAADRRGPRAHDDGPRPLQGDQRLARPLRRRPAAQADRPAPPAAARAPRRRARAARRRRIRGDREPLRATRAPPQRSRTRSSRACASRSRWEASGSASTRPSAHRSRPRMASTPRH